MALVSLFYFRFHMDNFTDFSVLFTSQGVSGRHSLPRVVLHLVPDVLRVFRSVHRVVARQHVVQGA